MKLVKCVFLYEQMLVGAPLSKELNLETEQRSGQLLTAMVEIGSLKAYIFTCLMNYVKRMQLLQPENMWGCSAAMELHGHCKIVPLSQARIEKLSLFLHFCLAAF